MLVFIDESGDSGLKLTSGSSPYFVVAMVTFEDRDAATECERAIADVRRSLGLSPRFEFHYARNSASQQRSFLEVASRFPFEVDIVAIDKARLDLREMPAGIRVYPWAARLVVETGTSRLTNASVVIDGRSDRTFRRELQSRFREAMIHSGEKAVRSVKTQPAHQNTLLQLADYVASVYGGALKQRANPVSQRRRYFAARERTFLIVP